MLFFNYFYIFAEKEFTSNEQGGILPIHIEQSLSALVVKLNKNFHCQRKGGGGNVELNSIVKPPKM